MGMLLTRHYRTNNANTQTSTNTNNVGVAKEVAPIPSKPEPKKESEYTEEQIKAMNGTALRKLAEKSGVENPEELTAKELKAVLVDLLVK